MNSLFDSLQDWEDQLKGEFNSPDVLQIDQLIRDNSEAAPSKNGGLTP
ncbi:MAG: hypothetical protein ABJP66_07815 [Hyphomicrobiales bacterium]